MTLKTNSKELRSTLWEAAKIMRGSAVDRTDWESHLDLHPRGHCPLDVHFKEILQWQSSNPTRKMNYMDA